VLHELLNQSELDFDSLLAAFFNVTMTDRCERR